MKLNKQKTSGRSNCNISKFRNITLPQSKKDELEYLQSGLTVYKLKSKHFYIHANTIQKEIGFVFSGLLRAFYVDKGGNEISVNFIRERRYAAQEALHCQSITSFDRSTIPIAIGIVLLFKFNAD
jgi:CRP-like cAMP-binding protein